MKFTLVALVSRVAALVFCASLALGAEDPFQGMKTYTLGTDRKDLDAVEAQVRKALGDRQASAVLEKKLAALLSPDTTFEASQFVCRQLRLIGTEASVPALAALLPDLKLSSSARYALEAMPNTLAGKALRDALKTAQGEALVGVINSVGLRADQDAVDNLVPILSGKDPACVKAAVTALGKIGGVPALGVLCAVAVPFAPDAADNATVVVRLDEGVKPTLLDGVLVDAFLACAERFVKDGQSDYSREIYRRLYAVPVLAPHLKVAALHGLLTVSPSEAIPAVVALVGGENASLRAIAAGFVRELPAADVEQSILPQLGQLPATQHAVLLTALAERKEASIIPVLMQATRHADAQVRVAALRGLGIPEGTKEGVQRLAEVAAASAEAEQAVARESLARIRGAAVEAAITAGMNEGAAGLRAEMIRATAARNMRTAVPALLEAASAPEETIRIAGFDALAGLAGAEHYPALVAKLNLAKSEAEAEAAAKAVVATGLKVEDVEGRARPLAAAFASAGPEVKLAIVDCLGGLGGVTALHTVAAVATGGAADLKSKAISTLAGWPDASAMDTLMSIAQSTENQAHRVVALRGYLQQMEQSTNRSSSESLALYVKAMGVAKRPEEKRLVISGLANVPELEALKLVEPLLADSDLKNEAGLAVARISRAIANAHPAQARAAVTRVRSVVQNENVLARATEVIDYLERSEDFVGAWMLSGPYTQKDGLFAAVFEPEKADGKAQWRPVQADGGIVSLDRAIGGDNRVAYLRAVVSVPAACKARLELGSDDGVKAWLNGRVVHSNDVDRGLVAGQDKVEVALNEGKNTLLLKITQGGGGWAACCRIRAADGGKLAGLQCGAE